jgi:RNA polymerase sigma-70 factor (ECF subfamily)
MAQRPGEAVEYASASARLRAMYDAHAKPVYRLLLRLTFGDRQAAEDLLHETMSRADQKIDDVNLDIGTLRPWLIAMAQQIAVDTGLARRASPIDVRAVGASPIPARGRTIDGKLSSATIRQALMSLTPNHRNVIIEIYFRGRSASEVARLFGIHEGTVESWAYHALRALGTAIGPTSDVIVPS